MIKYWEMMNGFEIQNVLKAMISKKLEFCNGAHYNSLIVLRNTF